jgi:penicillin-binding protein 1A
VLREMGEDGYITARERKAEAEDMPLLTVQNGDLPAFREALPPRDYFTDEIAASCPPPSARRSSSAAA